MTSVNVTTTKNTVTVTGGDSKVVTVTTAGPQGPPGDFGLDQSAKIDGSLIYYSASAGSFKADAVNTTSTLTDGGNF